MRVYGLWYGGPNYAAPCVPEDVEEFDSIADARGAFESRAGFDPYYPCVEESEMWLLFARPEPDTDVYPDRVLSMGPRGGVRCSDG